MVNSLWMESSTPISSDGRNVYWEIVETVFSDHRPLDILEIGVYKGALVKALEHRNICIRSYTGVDPYLGSFSDSYFHVYWNGRSAAEAVYREAKALYDAKGFSLIRDLSAGYWHKSSQTFDVIIVDGDHSHRFALWDMHHWFKRLRGNGLMMIDDYDNPQTPEVTKATTDFLHGNRHGIAHVGYQHYEFINSNVDVPVGMSVVYVQRVAGECQQPRHEDFPARLTFPEMTLKVARNLYRLRPKREQNVAA